MIEAASSYQKRIPKYKHYIYFHWVSQLWLQIPFYILTNIDVDRICIYDIEFMAFTNVQSITVFHN